MATQEECKDLTFEEREQNFKKYVQLRNVSSEPATGEEIKRFYDLHAQDYDRILKDIKFIAQIIGPQELDKQLKVMKCPPDAKIADVGAGTGMPGQTMKELGYTNMTAFDISPGMLEEAKKKDVYTDFILCDFNEDTMEKYHKQFDHAISIGSFLSGNLTCGALDKIARIVKSGGLVCISFRERNLESEELGYKQKLEEMEKNGIWKELSRVLDDYNENPHPSEGTKLVKAYYIVFKVC